MKIHFQASALLSIALPAALLLVQPAFGQTSTFSVTDFRPLNAVSDVMEQALGAILAKPESSDAEKTAMIEPLLVSYRTNQLAEDFKVEQANGMFYITPTKALSKNGVTVAASSLMALPVTFPAQLLSGADAIQLVLDSVGRAANVKIGQAAVIFLSDQKVMIGATGEPARDVLSKIVKALTGARVSYRLLSIPQGKGGTDYLLSMQYAGSAPWAKSAFEITGFPFGVTPLSDATSPIASHAVRSPATVRPGTPAGVSLFGTSAPAKQPSQ